jgi:hypothetical protein
MRDAINHHAAGTADAFTAIVIECDWLLSLLNQSPINYVQHFEERHV